MQEEGCIVPDDANGGRKCLKGCALRIRICRESLLRLTHLKSGEMLCRYSANRSKGTSVVPSSSIL